MNNLEKKIDALIDALGFDVEEVASDVFVGNYGGEDMYIPQFTGYKLTKRKPDISTKGITPQ